MQPLKARVRNGRLVLDEPTDWPEGIEVLLVPADEADKMGEEERRTLYAEILAASDEADQGLGEDAEDVIARQQARVDEALDARGRAARA